MVVVTDCQAVFNLIRQEHKRRMDYRSKMAGYVAQVNFGLIEDIIKVKSHCTKKQSEQIGQASYHSQSSTSWGHKSGAHSWGTSWEHKSGAHS